MAAKKKSATAATESASATALSSEVAAQVTELKAQAQTQFLGKNYSQAVDTYNQAIKLVGDAPEKTDLLTKVAGCYLIDKKFKEAIKACGATLDQQPTAIAALKTRAKAYEQLGLFKQALADAEAINKGEGASGETREMERRLKAAMSANKAKLAAAPTTPAPKTEARNPFPYTVTVKASLEDDTRVFTASLMITYAELLEAIKAKFTNAGPVVLKYVGKDGASVTIASRNDIQAYLGDLMVQYQRQMQSAAAPKAGNSLPPMRIQVVKVASESRVPKPPADELSHIQQKAVEAAKDEQPAAPQQYESHDEWLVDFARIFSEITGIEPVAHHEHINLGNEKLAKAMEAVDDDKAQPLFEKASEHFKDATCASLIQWGNIHVIRADRQGQALLKTGKALEGKALDSVLKEYDESEKKYNEALKIKADAWEANGSLGQLEWERAKAKLGYIVPTPPVPDLASPSEGEEKQDAAAAVKEALLKLDAKKVGQVQKHVDGSTKWFDQALRLAKAAEEKKKQEEESEEATDGETKPELTAEQQQQQQLQTPSGNMNVMHGNILYEWSQVLAAVGKEWKLVLDSAVAKFRSAGAAEADIRGALKSHFRKEELDLGPDPEPEAAAEPAKEEAKDDKAKAPAPEAKGLPSLEVKKKAKAAA